MHDEKNAVSDELKLKMEEEEAIKSVKTSEEYLHWWNMQKATLAAFILFLVASIIWSWWFMIISCTFLSINLYANFKRLRLLHKPKTPHR